MTDDTTRPPFSDADDRAAGEDAERDRSALPDHEFDDDRSAGGGIMAAGGTATDRGTGDLGPEGPEADNDESVLDTGIATGAQVGAAQAWVPSDPGDADRERLTDQNDLLLGEHDRDPDSD